MNIITYESMSIKRIIETTDFYLLQKRIFPFIWWTIDSIPKATDSTLMDDSTYRSNVTRLKEAERKSISLIVSLLI